MRSRNLKRLWVAAGSLVLVLTLAVGAASAAGKKKKGKPKLSPQTIAAITNAKHLMSQGSHGDVEAGIQSLGLLGTKHAVEPLVERIRAGLPPDLLETAIVTLMALGQKSSGPALIELTTHRRETVRLRAVEALAAVNPPGAEGALTAALSDSDPKVRSAAATALGEIRARKSVETLVLALDRGNMEASGAIGKLLRPGEAERLLGYLGKIPFRSLGPALGEMLQRSDVKEGTKLKIVARLEEVGTPEVKGYLGDLVSNAGESLGPKVSKAVLRAMQEIAD